jgi:hypothetical protein
MIVLQTNDVCVKIKERVLKGENGHNLSLRKTESRLDHSGSV